MFVAYKLGTITRSKVAYPHSSIYGWSQQEAQLVLTNPHDAF